MKEKLKAYRKKSLVMYVCFYLWVAAILIDLYPLIFGGTVRIFAIIVDVIILAAFYLDIKCTYKKHLENRGN